MARRVALPRLTDASLAPLATLDWFLYWHKRLEQEQQACGSRGHRDASAFYPCPVILPCLPCVPPHADEDEAPEARRTCAHAASSRATDSSRRSGNLLYKDI